MQIRKSPSECNTKSRIHIGFALNNTEPLRSIDIAFSYTQLIDSILYFPKTNYLPPENLIPPIVEKYFATGVIFKRDSLKHFFWVAF